MTSDEALERIGTLESRNPRALALARCCSFAVLIEPQLVRKLRLELVPRSRAMDEADLWFSRLVQSRNSEGIVLFPEVAEQLRHGLNQEDASQAWTRTQALHAGLPAAIRVEEELAFLSRDNDGNRTRIDELLRAAISQMVAGQQSELANWAGRALPRMPAGIQETEPGKVLGIASDVRLGRNARLEERLGKMSRIPDWLSDALPRIELTKVGVALRPEGVEFGPAAGYAFTIEVPDTQPAVVELRWQATDGAHSSLVFIKSGEGTAPQPVGTGSVQLVTLANQVYTLEPKTTTVVGTIGPGLVARAYSESYGARICWSTRSAIPGCLGFALEKRYSSADPPIVVEQFQRFRSEGLPNEPVRTPTTESPIQRFSWRDIPDSTATSTEYRVIPMTGNPKNLRRLDELASNWTPPVYFGASESEPVTVYFNRASTYLGWLVTSRPDLFETKGRPKIEDAVSTPGDQLRELLGGDLLRRLLSLLAEARTSKTTIYVAAYDLSDPQLITELCAFGSLANVLLTDTAALDRSTRSQQAANANAIVRNQLKKAGVRVLERNVTRGRLSHNKFLVICGPDGQAQKVWTGNTSWTSRSLCLRSNVAIVVDSNQVAALFLKQWNQLVSAGDRVSAELVTQNSIPVSPVPVSGAQVTVQFTPVSAGQDLLTCERLIRSAKEGVLYVASESGRGNRLIDTIQRLKNVFVSGVQRQGPTVTLYKQGKVFTARSAPDVGADVKQVLKPWLGRLGRFGSSSVQSRIIVIDPFGEHPTVITGSHGLSLSASGKNDENLLIIENESDLSARCAAYIAALYDSHRSRVLKETSRRPSLTLSSDDHWQNEYFTPERRIELAFWLGARRKSSAVQPVSPPDDVTKQTSTAALTSDKAPAEQAATRKTTSKRGTAAKKKTASKKPLRKAAAPVTSARKKKSTGGKKSKGKLAKRKKQK